MNNLMSEKIDSLALALSKAQATIENVSKDKQGYQYKYADLAKCLDAVKKPLADNGLSISQVVALDNDKQVLVTFLMHESGQWLKSTFNIESVVMKQCNTLQQLGAGITYARRYALSAIIGLTQEDDDGQSLARQQEQGVIQEQIGEGAEAVTKLIMLCKESKIDAKEFTAFHNITSKNLEGVRRSIDNFTKLKEEFENAQHANSH